MKIGLRSILIPVTLIACTTARAQAPSYDWVSEAISTDATAIVKQVVADGNGNIYVNGTYGGTLAIGDSVFQSTDPPATDIFLAKLNDAGEFVWSKRFGYDEWERCNDMVLDPAGNVYITGQYRDSIRFDDILLANGTFHGIYVAKLSPDGEALWATGSDGPGISSFRDEAYAIALDDAGNVIIGGSFAKDTLMFQHVHLPRVYGPGGTGSSNGFVAKFDGNGNPLWAVGEEQGTDPGSNTVSRLTTDANGNIFVGGHFGGLGVVLGEHTLNTTNFQDAFIGKMDPTGNYQWVHAITGFSLTSATYESISGLAWDGGHMYVSGAYMGLSVTLDDITIEHPNDPQPQLLSNPFISNWTVMGARYGVRRSVYRIAMRPFRN